MLKAAHQHVGVLVLVLVLLCMSLVASQQQEEIAPDAASTGPVTTASMPQSTSYNPKDPFTRRQTVSVYAGTGKRGRPLYYPLKFPRMPPLPPGNPGTYVRLEVTDTCGIFTLFHTVYQAAGAGPPPHVHYAEDEYFISAGTGSTRVFHNQKLNEKLLKPLKPGRLPGFNVAPITVGSALLNGTGNGVDKWGGQLVLSPAGNVHYFERVTNITDFFTVYLDGFADADIINYVLYGQHSPSELLLYSGLYGIPTDATGAFVTDAKGTNFTDATGARKLYRNVRGPIDKPDTYQAAERLQGVFDWVEQYRCCKQCVW